MVIGVAGDENDLHRVVALAKLFCHRDAVHRAHFDVQQENVVVVFFCVAEEEALGGGKIVDMHRVTGGRSPGAHHIQNILSVRTGVVADRNFVLHTLTNPI